MDIMADIYFWNSNEYLKEISENKLNISENMTLEYDMDTLSQEGFGSYLALLSIFPVRALRDKLVRKYAWAIPTPEALKAIAKYPSIIEIGAGTGYWAYLLKKMGVDVICYDTSIGDKPPEYAWHLIENGDERSIGDHVDRALFLCWPNYDSPMAANCLKIYKGDIVIYIGEGSGGCTGDDEFHDMLEKEWTEIENIKILKWFGIYDHLCIFRRKEEKIK